MKQGLDDTHLVSRIADLENSIRQWAKEKCIWDESESKFWSHIEYFDEEPGEIPCLLVLTAGGEFGKFLSHGAYDELYEEFRSLLKEQGISKELESFGVTTFWLYSDDDPDLPKFKDLFEWQWICSLIQPEFSDLYEEIYDWFAKKPNDFYQLTPRQFEIITDGVFRNNGYTTKLGSGQADGGVDIRLYSNEVIGEAITLVQAKRYADHLPINLGAVQALSAAVEDERANRGLFVTTSRYLPSAKKFASRQNQKLLLATSKELSEWSGFARDTIIRDKSRLVKQSHVQQLLVSPVKHGTLEGKIFRAHTGITMILNSFAMVIKESKSAVLLMSLPHKDISGDGQEGYEIPVRTVNLSKETVFRAKKIIKDGEVTLWGDGNLYFEWDDKPVYFSWLD